MRKTIMAAIGAAALLSAGGIALVLLHGGDPLAAGKRRLAQGDEKAAALYFREAVRAHPNNPEAAFLLGRSELNLGNAAAAELELKRARAYGWPEAAILYPLGQAYLAQSQAKSLLSEVDPEQVPAGLRPEALALRAAAELSLKDISQAAALAAEAVSAAPRDPRVLIAGAKIALVQGDEALASRRVDGVLRGEPPPDQTIQDDALLLQGEIFMRHGDAAQALAKAEEIAAKSPLRLDAKLLQARALAGSGHAAEARRIVQGVLKRAPKDIAANYLLAVLAVQASDYAVAESALQRVGPVIGELPRGNYFLAVAKLGVKQLAQADDAARQFLAGAPADASGLKLMATIDLARNRPEAAMHLLRNGVLAAHEDADTDDLHGRALGMLGDMQAAHDYFQKASALHPGDANVLNRLAAAELTLGHVSEGEADLQHSLELAPQQRAAWVALVESDLARGDLESARADLAHRQASLGATDTGALLAADIARAGLDDAGAERILRAAHDKFPASSTVTAALYRLMRARGEPEEARRILQAAQAAHPADAGLLALLLADLAAARETGAAAKAAEASHNAAPGDPRITAALAGAYAQAGQVGRAVGLLDRASAGSNAELDALRASLLAANGKPDQAIAVLWSLLERMPGDVALRISLAALLGKGGDFVGARRVLTAGLALQPGNAALLKAVVETDFAQAGSAKAGEAAALATAQALQAQPANLPAAAILPGLIYQAAGDAAKAASSYAAAFAKAPSGALAVAAAAAERTAGHEAAAETLLARWTGAHPDDLPALLFLSSLQLDDGKKVAAEASLMAVLAGEPTNAAALNNLAWLKQHQGDLGAARQFAQRAYYQAPLPEMADTLGWIIQQQGDTPAALPLLKKALAGGAPSLHAAASYHLAVALAASGDKDGARGEIRDSLAQNVSFHDRADAEKFAASLQ